MFFGREVGGEIVHVAVAAVLQPFAVEIEAERSFECDKPVALEAGIRYERREVRTHRYLVPFCVSSCQYRGMARLEKIEAHLHFKEALAVVKRLRKEGFRGASRRRLRARRASRFKRRERHRHRDFGQAR